MRGQRTEERDRETGREGERKKERESTQVVSSAAYFQPRSSPETGLKRSDGETGSFRSCEIASKLARQNRKCDGGKTMIDRKGKRGGGRGRETEKEKGRVEYISRSACSITRKGC